MITDMAKLSDITGTLRYPASVIERMSLFYPDFPALTEAEYRQLVWQTEISVEEFNIIHATKVTNALAFVESKIKLHDYLNLSEANKWIQPYIKNNFKGYDKAEAHLKSVDDFHMKKYGHHYELWYIDIKNEIPLLEWDTEMADRIVKK